MRFDLTEAFAKRLKSKSVRVKVKKPVIVDIDQDFAVRVLAGGYRETIAEQIEKSGRTVKSSTAERRQRAAKRPDPERYRGKRPNRRGRKMGIDSGRFISELKIIKSGGKALLANPPGRGKAHLVLRGVAPAIKGKMPPRSPARKALRAIAEVSITANPRKAASKKAKLSAKARN